MPSTHETRLEMTDSNVSYAFTVFTPTYNRAHTLHRVYESLRGQTFRDFEWLVVDDGSTDDTRQKVNGWRQEADFPVRYVFQANAGKHVAFNRGVREARGELFLTLDSDDACVPRALERLKVHWDSIPAQEKERFTGVTSLCMDEQGKLVGERFPGNITDSDSIEVELILRVKGEKWGFHRTAVLRQYPFPEPAGVKFIPESIVWLSIARTYKTRFVNECLRIYHMGDASGDRLTALTRSTAYGRLLFHASVMTRYRNVAARAPASFAKSIVNYARYSFACGIGIRGQLSEAPSLELKTLVALLVPAGYAFYLRDRCNAALARN
jgi:glycosyltransferase involved in cell wall biosynthesis